MSDDRCCECGGGGGIFGGSTLIWIVVIILVLCPDILCGILPGFGGGYKKC